MVFEPRGVLVAILRDAEEADRAVDALRSAGFAERKLRVYTSQEILADHDLDAAQRSVPRRVVGALTDDQATIALHWTSAWELAARSRCRMRSGC